MLMARASRVNSKMPRTSSWSAQSLTSPPAARARFMAATMAPMPELSMYPTPPRSMMTRDWPPSMRPASVRFTSSTVAMSRSPCGATTATPLDCVTSMSMISFVLAPSLLESRAGPLGGGSPPLAVLDHGPARAPLPGDVDREAVGDTLDEKEPVAAVGEGVEVGRLVQLGVEGLAEILDLDDEGESRRTERDLERLAAQALVCVLDGVRAELADRQQEAGLLLLRHAVVAELLAEPLAKPHEVLGFAGHREGATGGLGRHAAVQNSMRGLRASLSAASGGRRTPGSRSPTAR